MSQQTVFCHTFCFKFLPLVAVLTSLSDGLWSGHARWNKLYSSQSCFGQNVLSHFEKGNRNNTVHGCYFPMIFLNFNLLCKCFWTIWLPTNLICFASCFVRSPLGVWVLEAWKHMTLFHWCSSTGMVCINFAPCPVERNWIVELFPSFIVFQTFIVEVEGCPPHPQLPHFFLPTHSGRLLLSALYKSLLSSTSSMI